MATTATTTNAQSRSSSFNLLFNFNSSGEVRESFEPGVQFIEVKPIHEVVLKNSKNIAIIPKLKKRINRIIMQKKKDYNNNVIDEQQPRLQQRQRRQRFYSYCKDDNDKLPELFFNMLKNQKMLRYEFVHYCLSIKNLNPNMQNKNDNDNQPLHYASKRGNIYLAKMLLLQAKANVNGRNKHGETPLMLACQYKKSRHVKFIRFLLFTSSWEDGSNDNDNKCTKKNSKNDASSNNCYCDVDCIDNEGNSALSHAIRSSNVKAVKILLGYYVKRNKNNDRCGICAADLELATSSSETSSANDSAIIRANTFISLDSNNTHDTVATVAACTILARQIREEKTGIKLENDYAYKKKNVFLYYFTKARPYCSFCCDDKDSKRHNFWKMHPSSCVIVNMIDDAIGKWNNEHEHHDEGDDNNCNDNKDRKKVCYYICTWRKYFFCQLDGKKE